MRTAEWALCTSTVLSQGEPLRMRVERRLPALSSLRGQMQAQETRLTSLGKRLMSVPISERICSAARFLTPGTELNCSTAVRKGAMAASTSRSILAIATSKAIDLIEVKPQQEAVLPGHAATQGLPQGLLRSLYPGIG